MFHVTKYCVYIEILSILKIPFIRTLRITPGTNKPQMRYVGQTGLQIIRSKVLSPISKGKPKVDALRDH